MTKHSDQLRNAVALAYQANEGAPKVVATGKGLIAEKIIDMARAHGVHVHESREMVAMLMDLNLDQHIPPHLYRVIAELLAWLYKMDAALHPDQKTG